MEANKEVDIEAISPSVMAKGKEGRTEIAERRLGEVDVGTAEDSGIVRRHK